MCNLNFNCIITDDGFQGRERHWKDYSAIMTFGSPSLGRLHSVIGQNNPERDPDQIWIARGMESSISKLDYNGPLFKDLFNFSVALSHRSTFFDSYFEVQESQEELSLSQIKENYNKQKKDNTFCWMVSQCAGNVGEVMAIANYYTKQNYFP